MLTFKKPEIADLGWMAPLIAQSGMMGCEYAPGTFLIWQEKYPTEVCRYGNCFLAKGADYFGFPAGPAAELPGALEALKTYAMEQGLPFRFYGVTPQGVETLESWMPEKFRFTPQRGDWDYIYESSDLAELPGKKYHGKRNHISQFQRSFSYEYEDIGPKNLEECQDAAQRWCSLNGCEGDYSQELAAIRFALRHFEEMRLRGGMIKVDGQVAAFTVGEEISPEVFDLHFEKAFPEYNGAYAVINQEFARRNLLCYKYINREEDLGIEGLRRAKLSYHPAILLEKNTAEWTDD